jgi:hypothetical protein
LGTRTSALLERCEVSDLFILVVSGIKRTVCGLRGGDVFDDSIFAVALADVWFGGG